jgi:hypothetical protein
LKIKKFKIFLKFLKTVKWQLAVTKWPFGDHGLGREWVRLTVKVLGDHSELVLLALFQALDRAAVFEAVERALDPSLRTIL